MIGIQDDTRIYESPTSEADAWAGTPASAGAGIKVALATSAEDEMTPEHQAAARKRCGDQILLSVADGPEAIEIYTSEDEGVVDWSPSFPAVYLQVNMDGMRFKCGPFTLGSIHAQLMEQLSKEHIQRLEAVAMAARGFRQYVEPYYKADDKQEYRLMAQLTMPMQDWEALEAALKQLEER